MNTAEKLRFLADRAEDGKEFYMRENHLQFINGELKIIHYNQHFNSNLSLELISKHNFYLPPQWSFTEDEKAILRNLPDEVKWIARDKTGWLQLFQEKPQKRNAIWSEPNWTSFSLFDKTFQSIQWSDDEPCEFRKFL